MEARHLKLGKTATLVTTRSSSSSHMNHVELQNGCLSLGHASTFIPSTLTGTCVDPETGKINEDKLSNNMELAIDAYISRVNGTPCRTTAIQLFIGVTNSSHVRNRESLLIFLKGSKKEKERLKHANPELF